MEHPWILLGSAVVSCPLIWRTFQFLFPNLREDLREDGIWLVFGAVADFSVVTWTLAKLLWFVFLCAAYVDVVYKMHCCLFEIADMPNPPLEPILNYGS
jgi:hypothetical protein